MYAFLSFEFGKLKFVYHTIDIYSRFQLATVLSSEKDNSINTYLLEVIAILEIPEEIKTSTVPAYVSNIMKHFFCIL